jgi:hypothetical protein
MSAATVLDLDTATLTPVVRALLANGTAAVQDWQATLIVLGKASPADVYRITGTALVREGYAQNESMPAKSVKWSLVLKEIDTTSTSGLASNNASDDPASHWYWKREQLVYQSGLFDVLPDGFVAPHVYQLDEQPQGNRIWMEDVHDDVGETWPVDHYRYVARHFGRFSGMHLVDHPLPTWPWLLKDTIRSRAESHSWPEFAKHYPELSKSNPLVQRGWNAELVAGFERIWQEREQFIQVLACLPQTLLHADVGRKNLMARRRPNGEFETVVIDWGLAAIGPLGHDLATLLTQPTFWFLGVRVQDLPKLDPLAFDAYVQGLADVGWHGDRAVVRLGYTLSVVMRIGLGIMIPEWAARDERTRLFLESAIGHPIEELADTLHDLRGYIIACADEARQLIATPAIRNLL